MTESLMTGNPPVAIGGLGGSGTRLFAGMLDRLGYYLGGDLNAERDNLWFTLLFKRIEILSVADGEFERLLRLFVAAMTQGGKQCDADDALLDELASADRPGLPALWLRKRVDSLRRAATRSAPASGWGWKEPNTHVVLDRLLALMPGMKYIHVARNGLDMAYSENRNQLRLWGRHFVGPECGDSPYHALKYWHAVHRRVLEIGRTMGSRFLFIPYEAFCGDPWRGLERLLAFLDVDAPRPLVEDLAGMVRPPSSIGRYRQHGLEVFDPADVAYVRELGFDG